MKKFDSAGTRAAPSAATSNVRPFTSATPVTTTAHAPVYVQVMVPLSVALRTALFQLAPLPFGATTVTVSMLSEVAVTPALPTNLLICAATASAVRARVVLVVVAPRI